MHNEYVILSTESRSRATCGKCSPSLVWALSKTFWKIFITSAFFKLCVELLSFAGPQLLK